MTAPSSSPRMGYGQTTPALRYTGSHVPSRDPSVLQGRPGYGSGGYLGRHNRLNSQYQVFRFIDGECCELKDKGILSEYLGNKMDMGILKTQTRIFGSPYNFKKTVL